MLLDLLLGVEGLVELGLVSFGQLIVSDLGVGHLVLEPAWTGLQIGLLRAPRARHGLVAGDWRRGWARLLRCHRRDLFGLDPRRVRGGVGSALDVLGRVLLALGDHAGDLLLDLRRLARVLELVRLIEVLGRSGVDGLADSGDERRLVERPGLGRRHLVDLGRAGLRGRLV